MITALRTPLLSSEFKINDTPQIATNTLRSRITQAVKPYFAAVSAVGGVMGAGACAVLYGYYSQGPAVQATLFACSAIAGSAIQSLVGLAEDKAKAVEGSSQETELTNPSESFFYRMKPLEAPTWMQKQATYMRTLRNRSVLDHTKTLVHYMQQKLPVPLHFFFLTMYSVNFTAGTALSFLSMGMYGHILIIRATRLAKNIHNSAPLEDRSCKSWKEWWKRYWVQVLSAGIGVPGFTVAAVTTYGGLSPQRLRGNIAMQVDAAVLCGGISLLLVGKSLGSVCLAKIDRSLYLRADQRGFSRTALRVMRFVFTRQLALGSTALLVFVQANNARMNVSAQVEVQIGEVITIAALMWLSVLMLGMASGSNDHEFRNGEVCLLYPSEPALTDIAHNQSTSAKITSVIRSLWKPAVVAGIAMAFSYTDISVTPDRPLLHTAWLWAIGSALFSYYVRDVTNTRKPAQCVTKLIDRAHVDLYLLSSFGLILFNYYALNIGNPTSEGTYSDLGRFGYMICGGLAMGITQNQLDTDSQYHQGASFKGEIHGNPIQ